MRYFIDISSFLTKTGKNLNYEIYIFMAEILLRVYIVVIRYQTAGQGKPMRHPVLYMLIRAHEVQ